MKIIQFVKSLSVASCAMAILTGCVSFPKNQLPAAIMQPPSEGIKKPTVSYSFSSGTDFGFKQEHQENVRRALEKEFVETLKESGYFAATVKTGGQCDISIQIRLVDYCSPAAMIPAMITGMSLYTIPSWGTDRYDITAKVSTLDKRERSYALTDSMRTFQWLPLIVMAPFNNPLKVTKDFRKNIWMNLILKMQEDGTLSEAAHHDNIS